MKLKLLISKQIARTACIICLLAFTPFVSDASDALSLPPEEDNKEVPISTAEAAIAAPNVQIVKGYGTDGGGIKVFQSNVIYFKCPLCCEGWGPCGADGGSSPNCHAQIQDTLQCNPLNLTEPGSCTPCIDITWDYNALGHIKIAVHSLNRYWIVSVVSFYHEPWWSVHAIPVESIVEGGEEGNKIDPEGH